MNHRPFRDHHHHQTFFGRIDLATDPETIDQDTRDINIFVSELAEHGAIIDEVVREREGSILYITVSYSYPKEEDSDSQQAIDRLLLMATQPVSGR